MDTIVRCKLFYSAFHWPCCSFLCCLLRQFTRFCNRAREPLQKRNPAEGWRTDVQKDKPWERKTIRERDRNRQKEWLLGPRAVPCFPIVFPWIRWLSFVAVPSALSLTAGTVSPVISTSHCSDLSRSANVSPITTKFSLLPYANIIQTKTSATQSGHDSHVSEGSYINYMQGCCLKGFFTLILFQPWMAFLSHWNTEMSLGFKNNDKNVILGKIFLKFEGPVTK